MRQPDEYEEAIMRATTEEQPGPTSSKYSTADWIYTPYRLNPSCLEHSKVSLIFAHLLPVTFTHLLSPGSLGGLSPCVRSTPTADFLRLGNGVQQFRLGSIERSSRGVNGERYTVCATYSPEETENGVQPMRTINNEAEGRRTATPNEISLYTKNQPVEPRTILEIRRWIGKETGNHHRPNQYATSDDVLEVNATEIGSILTTRTPEQRYPGLRPNTATVPNANIMSTPKTTTLRSPRRGSSEKQPHQARHGNQFQWSRRGKLKLNIIADRTQINQYATPDVVLQVNATKIGRIPQRILALQQTELWKCDIMLPYRNYDTKRRRQQNVVICLILESEKSRLEG